MSSKHTPGPWTIELSGYGSIICKDGKSMAVAWPEGLGGPSFPHEANARLIAAAPELLEALLEAVECGMVPISSVKDGGASTHSRQVRCADMIRAAIAKATGGAQ